MWDRHLLATFADRRVYYGHIGNSVRFFNDFDTDCVSFILDGMDQAKFKCPRPSSNRRNSILAPVPTIFAGWLPRLGRVRRVLQQEFGWQENVFRNVSAFAAIIAQWLARRRRQASNLMDTLRRWGRHKEHSAEP